MPLTKAGEHLGARPDTSGDRRTARGFVRAVLMALLAGTILAILAPVGFASAQEGEEAVQGTIRAEDENGETVFIEGVEFIVSDADGNEIGVGVTDAEGFWQVPVPYNNRDFLSYRRLLLPLASDGETVDMLLALLIEDRTGQP